MDDIDGIDLQGQLRQNRAELRSLLDDSRAASERGAISAEFPRSRVMRLLSQNGTAKGLALLALVALAVSPRLGGLLLRAEPLRLLASRFLTGMR